MDMFTSADWGKKAYFVFLKSNLQILKHFFKANALHCGTECLVQYVRLYTAHLGKCTTSSGHFMHGDNLLTPYILHTTYCRKYIHSMNSIVACVFEHHVQSWPIFVTHIHTVFSYKSCTAGLKIYFDIKASYECNAMEGTSLH